MRRWREKRLLAAVRAKKPGAFEEFEKIARPTGELALRRAERAWPVLRSEHDDQLQAFFALLFEAEGKLLASYRGEAKLETWLFAVAYRLFLRRARQLSARKEGPLSSEAASGGSPEATDPLARENLKRALAELSAEDRAFLGLLFDQEVPVADLAAQLKISPDAVRMRKKRLLDRLRAELGVE